MRSKKSIALEMGIGLVVMIASCLVLFTPKAEAAKTPKTVTIYTECIDHRVFIKSVHIKSGTGLDRSSRYYEVGAFMPKKDKPGIQACKSDPSTIYEYK